MSPDREASSKPSAPLVKREGRKLEGPQTQSYHAIADRLANRDVLWGRILKEIFEENEYKKKSAVNEFGIAVRMGKFTESTKQAVTWIVYKQYRMYFDPAFEKDIDFGPTKRAIDDHLSQIATKTRTEIPRRVRQEGTGIVEGTFNSWIRTSPEQIEMRKAARDRRDALAQNGSVVFEDPEELARKEARAKETEEEKWLRDKLRDWGMSERYIDKRIRERRGKEKINE